MTGMRRGRMPAAGRGEPMDAPELIEGRRLAVYVAQAALGHG
jgi:hypothetical protein